MEPYGWLALLVLIVIAIRSLVKKYMKPDTDAAPQKDATRQEKPAAQPENAPVSPASVEPTKSVPKSPLDMPIDKYLVYLALGAVALYACLWIYGCADAASDVGNGLNMLTYRMKLLNMNPISRQGYRYYIENNTDMPQRERELQQKMDERQQKRDELRQKIEELNQRLNP